MPGWQIFDRLNFVVVSFIVIPRRRSFGEISAIYQLLSKQLINRANRSSNHRATLQVARCLLSLLSDNELIIRLCPCHHSGMLPRFARNHGNSLRSFPPGDYSPRAPSSATATIRHSFFFFSFSTFSKPTNKIILSHHTS
jgi:hypothetical protein